MRLALAGICCGDPRLVGRRVTFSMYQAICRVWAEEPPMRAMYEVAHGFKKSRNNDDDDNRVGDPAELAAMFGGMRA